MAPKNEQFSFGVGGYVKQLSQEGNDNVIDGQVLAGAEGVDKHCSNSAEASCLFGKPVL